MKTVFLFVTVMVCIHVDAQDLFRSGIFLHHSTGACIWGPNGSSTSVPQEMDAYNVFHGFTGSQAVTLNEEWWAPADNEWVTQHNFFEDPSNVTGIGFYLPGNRIIVIKSCFPSSAIEEAGGPDDTLTPDYKTVYNYKWHWRHILNVMKIHPQNFFVIWTNAPLEPNSTNAQQASLSDWFCTWAKDTLAPGLDPVFGPMPANVYVFDFFHKLTGSDGMMLPQYANGPGDSHPNAAATELVAPQFVQEIFDAAIAYETVIGIHSEPDFVEPALSVSPNPFSVETIVSFTTSGRQYAELDLIDANGRTLRVLWKGKSPGSHQLVLPGDDLAHGSFFLRLSDGKNTTSFRLIR